MWRYKDQTNFTPRGFPFSTPQPDKNRSCTHSSSPPSENNWKPSPPHSYSHSHSNNNLNLLHVIHKIPAGDSPYVRAKHVQLVDKNPSKAVSLFWAAINLGDRVDSALKDMTTAMKQLNRSDEAIEAIKSFRHLCPPEAQESLDNIMLELYKRSGRIDEQIQLLESRLKHIEDATMQKVNRMRFARSQGKKIQITMGQEYSRLLGNLAWAYLQQDKYKEAEEIYRKALSLEPDKNKQCNLAICLMYMNRMTEARFLLDTVKDSSKNRAIDESCAKSYERAVQVMHELESCKYHVTNSTKFSSFLDRNKATYYREEGKKGNSKSMQEAGFAYEKTYPSPVPTRSMPRALFTQPQIRDKAGFDIGCFRKFEFEQPLENQDMEVKMPGKSGEMMLEAGKRSKSWADITDDEEYGDENVDCRNIMHEKMESLNLNDRSTRDCLLIEEPYEL